MFNSKMFSHQEDNLLAVADVSQLGEDSPFFEEGSEFERLKNIEGIWYYFNRLNVPEKIRGRGIARKLLTEVISWADENGINILNEVLASGDMTKEQLMTLYEQFGFVKETDNAMIRIHTKS